jgi:hypothetical protein
VNLYLIVEGRRTEPRLYRAWLPHLYPGISEVRRVEDIAGCHFFLVPGMGYPSLLHRIQAACRDCQRWSFDHLLICADAESCEAEVHRREIEGTVLASRCTIPCTIIVADCCIETWLLGNAKVIRRHPTTEALRDWLAWYDVRQLDPERMPSHPQHRTRAVTHKECLKGVFRERGLNYSEKHPGEAASPGYLEQLVARGRTSRAQGAPHLASFMSLVDRLASFTADSGPENSP